MKKHYIITAIFLLGLLTANSQNNPFKMNNIPMPSLKKIKKSSGDTVWQYHKYEIYKWEDNQYQYWDYYFLFDYYPNSENIKTVKFVDYNNDSLFKTDYYYDSLDREISETTKNYEPETDDWINSTRADFFFTSSGKDSLRIVYSWNSNDSIWQYNSMHIMLWNEFGYIKYEADSIWTGQEWSIMGGRNYEYVLNDYNQVLEQAWYEYNNYLKEWVYHYKNVFTLIDEQTGEYNATTVYLWNNDSNEWVNFNRFTEMKPHNWNGFPYIVPEFEHLIMEAWLDNQWYYVKKDSIIYDSLGGKIWYYFVYDYDSNKWQPYFKQLDIYNEEGYQIYYYRQFMKDNQWVNHDGYKITYDFDGPRLKEVVKDEWDTITGQWIPFRKYLYDDYTYILNTPDIEKKDNSSGLRIIPNPSKGSILIRLNDETGKIKTVRVYDVSGKKVVDTNFTNKRNRERLNVSALKNGVYIINVTTKKGKVIKGKFVKN